MGAVQLHKADNKRVEQALIRSLIDFWSEHGGYERGLLGVGDCYQIVGGLRGVETSGGIKGLDNQTYSSTMILDNIQDDFESVGGAYLNAVESILHLILAVEITLNFHVSMLVSDVGVVKKNTD